MNGLRAPDVPLGGHLQNAGAQSSQKGFTWLRSCQRGGLSPEQSQVPELGDLALPEEPPGTSPAGVVRQPHVGREAQLTRPVCPRGRGAGFWLGTQAGVFWHLGRGL